MPTTTPWRVLKQYIWTDIPLFSEIIVALILTTPGKVPFYLKMIIRMHKKSPDDKDVRQSEKRSALSRFQAQETFVARFTENLAVNTIFVFQPTVCQWVINKKRI